MNKEFLELWNELERVLKDNYNKTVLDFENEINSEELKVCRILRNYHKHNNLKFVNFNKQQVEFLRELISDLILKSDGVKSVYQPQKELSLNNTLSDLLSTILKSKFGLVVIKTEDKYLLLNENQTLKLVKDHKLTTKLSKLTLKGLDYEVIRLDTSQKNLYVGQNYIVLDKKDKFKGIYKI